jgi:glutamate-1-semialdehyde 2,1-aminomutase/spore coat polysaccharide biosynthesis protein SpsF
MNKGVPKQFVVKCEYNDIETVIKEFEYGKVAAVIMEPYILEEPKEQYLTKIQKLCHRHNTVLIFDEIITGFRTPEWSAQKYYNVIPDLTCLGKAMGNGLPIACVCGKRKIMEVLKEDCFVSSTFGGELLSIAAALATIKFMEEQTVLQHIWEQGNRLISSFKQIVGDLSISNGVDIVGLPPRTYFKFPTNAHKSLFWQECLKQGILLGHSQFISYAHKQTEIDVTLRAMRHALYVMRKYGERPADGLEGEVLKETFRYEKEKK